MKVPKTQEKQQSTSHTSDSLSAEHLTTRDLDAQCTMIETLYPLRYGRAHSSPSSMKSVKVVGCTMQINPWYNNTPLQCLDKL
eukprot:15351407-Ditylum_brightwellii.AAC.1